MEELLITMQYLFLHLLVFSVIILFYEYIEKNKKETFRYG